MSAKTLTPADTGCCLELTASTNAAIERLISRSLTARTRRGLVDESGPRQASASQPRSKSPTSYRAPLRQLATARPTTIVPPCQAKGPLSQTPPRGWRVSGSAVAKKCSFGRRQRKLVSTRSSSEPTAGLSVSVCASRPRVGHLGKVVEVVVQVRLGRRRLLIIHLRTRQVVA